MLRRFRRWILVVLLTFSIGGHWVILQSGAWVGMLVNFSRTDSVAEAMVKTFDGDHPCKVCKFVEEGKKAEKAPERQFAKVKIDFYLGENPTQVWTPDSSELVFHFLLSNSDRTYPPLSPPPEYS